MAQASGSNTRITYDEESTFGTTPGTPDFTIVPFSSEGLGLKTELLRSNVIRGTRNPQMPSRGNRDVSGNIITELSPSMGTLLKHLVGTVTTTGASSPYTHVIKVGALPVGLTLEKGFTDIAQYFLYNGCRINKGSFEFLPSGPVPLTLDFMGAKRTVSGTSVDSTPTDPGHVPFQNFSAVILEGGSSIATVTSLKFDVENDMAGDNYVIGGGGYRYAIPEGATVVSGELTALFDSITLFTKAMNGTESSLKVTLSHGTGAGTAGNESIEFFIPELIYQEQDPTIKDARGVLVTLPFTAYYNDGADASALKITLKNPSPTI